MAETQQPNIVLEKPHESSYKNSRDAMTRKKGHGVDCFHPVLLHTEKPAFPHFQALGHISKPSSSPVDPPSHCDPSVTL